MSNMEEYADFAGQIEAISKSQAVIEFEMDGTNQDLAWEVSNTRFMR